MNKVYILILTLTLAVGKLYAQSETYKIEELSKAEKLLRAVPSNSLLFKNTKKNLIKISDMDNLVDFGTHPVMVGYLQSYQNHYPVTISPDIAWLLICQGFANHVNSDPEKIRKRLVKFKGKKTLIVQRNIEGLKSLSDFPWDSVFPEFTAQISDFTGKELIGNLSADFTTTTATSLVASQITIMESMKEFFNYKVVMMGCGISEVTVEGSVKDWEKILTRLDYLAKYDLKWWTSELKPVIQKIIDTKKGNLDKQFWMNMVKYHTAGAYGSYDGIDGWLLKFYPYHKVSPSSAPADYFAKHGVVQPNLNVTEININPPGALSLGRSDFKEIKSINVLPRELAIVPFIFEIKDNTGTIQKTLKMEFWAGFMGIKQDKTTFNVKPEIGWAVNQLAEE
ncbi:DUF4419 domain-containing protein [Pedobacter gandavensis]|uniref:DUF4419 domain-containing protein n=1 Tax=Pedobacter gandavensis TaxID=2679963 RepID=UPI00292E0B27|nr:DUF4419 domain-containing protein [Pedobacter gandavensis]